ncbi:MULTISPECIES: SAM-dependent methyltransferase [unclassified Knoellia]|uniref:SAM-dependent methyltransferase n=1 Tax=Knoellia altitudinis TaxID=3404795 RepID=UPI00360EB62A
MTDALGFYEHLTFNAPLSEARADALVGRLAAAAPSTVLDVGCGWGELLVRVGAACPEVSALGVDTEERHLERARSRAVELAVADRVRFENRPGDQLTEPADVVICIGSSHAFGDTAAEALVGLRKLVRPGGRLVLGEGTWEVRGPVEPELVWDDLVALPSVAGLVDVAVEAGLRPLWIETANEDELFAFESGYLADLEEWLVHHDDAAVRSRADEHRRRWLHGYRNAFGFAYLTLGVPALS